LASVEKKSLTRYAAVIALAFAAGAELARAAGSTCFLIQPGDTAAYLALRLTGNVSARNEPWFQIVDPATARFIPKAQYNRIHPGWQVCIAEDRAGGELIPARRDVPRPARAVSADLLRQFTAVPGAEIWLGASLLIVALLVWRITDRYSTDRHVLVSMMTHFGRRFIREFERPLLRPGCASRALRSGLRFKPRQRRVEILLAPNDGRRYPNLSDHRKNVEYDVGRVLQTLGDDRFVGEQLSERGGWVVVRCRFKTDAELGGGR
jgi:hypothetical protein